MIDLYSYMCRFAFPRSFPKTLRMVFLGVVLLFGSPVYSQDLKAFGRFSFIYPALLDIIRNPHDFMRGIQYEIDNFNPIYGKKYMPIEWRNLVDRETDDIFINDWRYRFSISINLSTIIYSTINYSFKITALREDVYIPEIYFGYGHYFYVPTYAGIPPNPYKKLLNDISMHSFSGFLGFAKSVKSDVKIFGGYRFAYGFMEIKFPDDLPDYINLVHSGDVDESWILHDLFAGITFLLPNSNWETLISIGFNPDLLLFAGKLEFLHKYVGLGLGYYANNALLPLRPFIRVQYEF